MPCFIFLYILFYDEFHFINTNYIKVVVMDAKNNNNNLLKCIQIKCEELL